MQRGVNLSKFRAVECVRIGIFRYAGGDPLHHDHVAYCALARSSWRNDDRSDRLRRRDKGRVRRCEFMVSLLQDRSRSSNVACCTVFTLSRFALDSVGSIITSAPLRVVVGMCGAHKRDSISLQ